MYEPVLFVHVMGAITLFMAVAVEMFGGAKLRRAETVDEVRTLTRVVLMIEPLFPVATLLLLLTGFYMASDRWELSDGWIVVSVVSLVVFAALGPLIQGRRMKAVLTAAADAPSGPLPADLRTRLADPVAWGSMHAMSTGAVGIVWLMTNKPDLVTSALVVVVLTLIGLAVGASGARRAAA